MAGINAAAKVLGKEPVILDRSQAYIGVLIDDLVTKGTKEPYRLLTSRAEYRLLLRHDNADLRLTEIGYQLGLISDERYQQFEIKKQQVEEEKKRLRKISIKPTPEVQSMLEEANATPLKEPMKAYDLLKRPELHYDSIDSVIESIENLSTEVKEQVEIQIKYEGYIKKANEQVERMKKMEDKKIPEDIDYDAISGLATEARQKLKLVQPLSVGQASRISGVNPADISILLVYIEHGRIAKLAN
jgi:tRNA uridine 5-carboxymethylaminomethyl modification enzyme